MDSNINSAAPQGNTLANELAEQYRKDRILIGGPPEAAFQGTAIGDPIKNQGAYRGRESLPRQEVDAKLSDRARAFQAQAPGTLAAARGVVAGGGILQWNGDTNQLIHGQQQRPEGPVMCEVRAQHTEITGLFAALDALEARLAPALVPRPESTVGAAIGGAAPQHPTRMLQEMAAVTARLTGLTARINRLADALVL